MNAATAKTPDGHYIWRTVEDGKVRSAHVQYDRTIRKWSDSPDPGEDFNCRCWAEPVDEALFDEKKDAIEPVRFGPVEIGLSALLGGLGISKAILNIIEQQLINEKDLNNIQIKNFARFVNKIPANSKESVEIIKQRNGDIKFSATSPGKVPGSKAIYEKTINAEGKTVDFRKIAYDKENKIIHVKNKMNNVGKNVKK